MRNVKFFFHYSKFPFTQLRFKHRKHLEQSTVKKSECLEPCNVPKKSFWNIFGKGKPQQKCFEKDKPKPPPECATVEFVTEEQAECDLKRVAEMGGKAFRTCGTAYVVQKEHLQTIKNVEFNDEEQILDELAKDPSLKGQNDPMPPFKSTETRLIELSDRKLHPLYKKLMSIPKKPEKSSQKVNSMSGGAPIYKTRSGPILPDEFPPQLKINREHFEKKNILYEYKKIDPPQQILAMMVEMKANERPPLIKPQPPAKKDCSEK